MVPTATHCQGLLQSSLLLEQAVEVVVIPIHCRGDSDVLQPTGHCIAALDVAEAVYHPRSCSAMLAPSGVGTDALIRIGSTMGFTERVSDGNERNRFLVMFHYPSAHLSNVLDCSAAGPGYRSAPADFRRLDHLDSIERFIEFPVTVVALVSRPSGFRPPVEVLFRIADVLASAASKPSLVRPNNSRVQCPVKIIRSAYENLRPNFCPSGQSRLDALSRFALSGQLLSSAKRSVRQAAPPQPSWRVVHSRSDTSPVMSP